MTLNDGYGDGIDVNTDQTKVGASIRTGLRYASIERLPGLTGSSTQRQMATMKARLIARYLLHTVGGRPEELIKGEQGDRYDGLVVSMGYGCGTIRIRKHGGPNNREWVDYIDITPNDGWHREVYNYLDPFFGFVSPELLAPSR